jgi:hypothetical protein
LIRQAHDRFEGNVKIQAENRNAFANGHTIELQPSSVYVLVNEQQ